MFIKSHLNKRALIFVALLNYFFSYVYSHADDAVNDSNRYGVKWGILPVGQFSTDQGFTFGILSRRFDYGTQAHLPFENLSTVQGIYSTLGPASFLLSFEKTGLGSENLRLFTSLIASTSSFQKYYGQGDLTPYSAQLNAAGYYYFNQTSASLNTYIRKKLSSGFEVRAGANLVLYRLSPSASSSQFAVDFGSTSHESFYTSIQTGLIVDRRDFEIVPSKGYYTSLLFNVSPSFLGTGSSWIKGDLDLRYYYSLIGNRWLWLAFQFVFSGSTPNSPLIERVRLGGQLTLRGVPLNRFITNYSTTQRADLRSILVRTSIFSVPIKAGLGLFLDTGHVGDSFSRLFQTGTQIATGLSIFGSIFTDDFLCNADIGNSQEGTFIYAGLGHAF